MPILDKTLILDPLDQASNPELFKKSFNTYFKVRSKLILISMRFKPKLKLPYIENNGDLISMRQFLIDCNLTYDDYIMALRSSISKATVFLKRKSSELTLNSYNKDILIRHRANMDIQYITDPYGCASYVSAYLLKSNAVMSGLLKRAEREVRELSNWSIRRKLNCMASKFHSAQEVGASEAIYSLGSMDVSRSSRASVYINTFKSSERYVLLKKESVMRQMKKNSVEIYQFGVLDHYKNRPDSFEHMCLADFAANYEYVSKDAYKNKDNPGSRRSTTRTNVEPEPDAVGSDDDLDQDLYSGLNRNNENDHEADLIANIEQAEQRDLLLHNQDLEPGLMEEQLAMHANYINEPLSGDSSLFSAPRGFSDNSSNITTSTTDQPVVPSSNPPTPAIAKIKYIPLKNNDGYVRERKFAKTVRCKRYDKVADEWNYYRVLLMLYLPWLDDVKEFESLISTFNVYSENIDIILENRAKHEAHSGEIYEAYYECLEQELVEHYDELNEELVEEVIQAQDILLRNMNDDDNELIEQQHGFHAENLLPNQLAFYERNIPSINDDVDITKFKFPERLSDEDYYNLMCRLNREQHIYMMNFLFNIKNLSEPFYHYVGGGAGVGKSYLIQAIYQTYIRYKSNTDKENSLDPFGNIIYVNDDKIYCVLCAPTGKAACSIGGVTCHSLCGLRKEYAFSELVGGKALKSKQKLFSDVQLIIIDECSMVGGNLFYKVDSRVRQFKGVSDEIFGGVSILCFGDLRQLGPVKDSWIFNTYNPPNSKREQNPYASILNSNGLWSHFRYFELTEIMRQRDDKDFAELLNSIGDYGLLGLTNQQIRILNSRIVATEADIPSDALLLYYTHFDVNKFNENAIKQNRPGSLVVCSALDTCQGNDAKKSSFINFMRTFQENLLKEEDNYKKVLNLKIGCKYMLVENINVSDGLYNGSIGILKHIIYRKTPCENRLPIKRLYLHFNESSHTGNANRREHRSVFAQDNINPITSSGVRLTLIEPKKLLLKFKKERNSDFKMEREQFPLVECEAITINKAEGQTYEKIGVPLNYTINGGKDSRNLDGNKLYVAMSRVTKLSGLYLTGRKHILTDAIRKLLPEEKEERKALCLQSNVQNELKRLRSKEVRLENVYGFLEVDDNMQQFHNPNRLRIMFANICTYNLKKRRAMQSDFGFNKCDIILLCETHGTYEKMSHLDANNKVINNYIIRSQSKLDNYQTLYSTGSLHSASSNGQLCFIREEKERRSEWTHTNSSKEKNGLIQLDSFNARVDMDKLRKMWEYNLFSYEFLCPSYLKLLVMCVYKHPQLNPGIFMSQFYSFLHLKLGLTRLNTKQKPIVIFGDFNIDFNTDSALLKELEDKFNLFPMFKNKRTF